MNGNGNGDNFYVSISFRHDGPRPYRSEEIAAVLKRIYLEVSEMTVGDDTFVLEKTFELVSAPEPHILLNYKRRTEPMVEQLSLFDRL